MVIFSIVILVYRRVYFSSRFPNHWGLFSNVQSLMVMNPGFDISWVIPLGRDDSPRCLRRDQPMIHQLVGGLEHVSPIYIYIYSILNNNPIWLIFFRGVGIPPTSQLFWNENGKRQHINFSESTSANQPADSHCGSFYEPQWCDKWKHEVVEALRSLRSSDSGSLGHWWIMIIM